MKTIALLVAAAACLAVALNFTTGLNTLLDVTSIVFTAVPILASFVAVGVKRQGILVVADIALQVAIIGMLIGSVGLLQNMSDPKAVGPAFALTLSVVFFFWVFRIGSCARYYATFPRYVEGVAN